MTSTECQKLQGKNEWDKKLSEKREWIIVKTKRFIWMGLIFLFGMVYQCPIRIIWGQTCAGCGMTRAIVSALKFDFRQACEYHPFYPIVILFAIYVFFREELFIGVLWEKIWLFVALILLTLRWMNGIL